MTITTVKRMNHLMQKSDARLSLKIPEEMNANLERVSKKLKTTKSKCAKDAISEWLMKYLA